MLNIKEVAVEGIRAYFAIITPEQAQEILTNNDNYFKIIKGNQQRKVRAKTVDIYTKDLSNDKWKINGETIKFDKEDRLMDGQHRLRSIVKSGKPMITLVVEGIDNEVMDTIDVGLKRSLENALQYLSVSYENGAASIVKAALQLKKHNPNLGQSNANVNISPLEVVDEYQQNAVIYNEAVHFAKGVYLSTRKVLKKTEIGAIYVYLTHDLGYDKDIVKEFFRLLSIYNGTQQSIYRTTIDNLEKMTKMGKDRINEYVWCWNAMINDNKTRRENKTDNPWFVKPENY